MAECDLSKDRDWSGQYYCGMHCVWFRTDVGYPTQCPVGEALDPEPGAPIGTTTCPCCGAGLEVEHGDEEGQIAVVGTKP